MKAFSWIMATFRAVLSWLTSSKRNIDHDWSRPNPSNDIGDFELFSFENPTEEIAIEPTADNFDGIFHRLIDESQDYGSRILSIKRGETHLVYYDRGRDLNLPRSQRGAIVGYSDEGFFVRNSFDDERLFVVRSSRWMDHIIGIVEPQREFRLEPGDRIHVGTTGKVIYCPLARC